MKTNKQLFLYFFCLPCGWGGGGGGTSDVDRSPAAGGEALVAAAD